MGSISHHPFPFLTPIKEPLGQEVTKIHANKFIVNNPIYALNTQIVEILAYLRKLGPRNTTVTSTLRPEVEIWPFRACAMKNMQYKRYYRNTWSFCHSVHMYTVSQKTSSTFLAITRESIDRFFYNIWQKCY